MCTADDLDVLADKFSAADAESDAWNKFFDRLEEEEDRRLAKKEARKAGRRSGGEDRGDMGNRICLHSINAFNTTSLTSQFMCVYVWSHSSKFKANSKRRTTDNRTCLLAVGSLFFAEGLPLPGAAAAGPGQFC